MSVLLVLMVVTKFALTPMVATIAHVTLAMCYQEMEKLALVCISDNHLLMLQIITHMRLYAQILMSVLLIMVVVLSGVITLMVALSVAVDLVLF